MQEERHKEYIEVLDHLRDSYVETGRDGIIRFANLTFIRELGFEHREDIAGKHFWHFIQAEFAAGVAQKIALLIKTAQPLDHFKTRYVGKDGKNFVGEASLSPLIRDGELLGMKGTIRNVTRKSEAEKEQAIQQDFMEALLEQTPVAVVNVGKDHKISYVNPAFQGLFGYTREEAIGKHLDDLISPSDKLNVEVISQPFFVGSLNYGHLVFYIDISERLKAEEQIKQAKEAAERRANELAAINRVAEKVSSSLKLEEILNTVCQELTRIFPVYKAGIALLRAKDSKLEILAFHSLLPAEKNRLGKVLYLEGEGCNEVQHLIKAKKTVRIRDAQGDPLVKPLHNLFGKTNAGSFMVVPLVARGKTLGILGMTLKDAEYELKQTRIALAETVASQIATAVENAQLYAQTEKALDVAERDLEIGKEIQSGFFPPYLPEIPGWELTTYFKAARQVSGDFYDVFPLKNSSHVCLVVADVCDKGVGAALFMVLLRSLIRSYSEFHEENASVNDLLYGTAHKVNRYIVDTHGQSNMFATLFLGILEPESNSLYYVNGGHDSPRLFSATGRLKHTLLPTGPAFGFSADLEFDIESCLFDPGDMLFACTDGLSEARDPDGHFYTDERLTAQAGRGWPSAFSAVKHLELDVSTHMGDQVQYDDITLLALRRQRENEIVCHEFTQKAVLSGLPLFRRFVAEVCSRMKLAPGPSEHMQLAVDEACSNLILHGYKGMEAGEIVLKVKVTKEVFQVQIEDTGHSFDPSFLDPPELGEDLNERPIGGLGIFMITQLVDELSYDSKEGRNYLVLRINYSTNTN